MTFAPFCAASIRFSSYASNLVPDWTVTVPSESFIYHDCATATINESSSSSTSRSDSSSSSSSKKQSSSSSSDTSKKSSSY